MGRFVAGGIAALLAVAGGLFWWQGIAGPERSTLPPPPPATMAAIEVPGEGDEATQGDAPPMPAEADPRSKEERRFDRYDRDRDGIIGRNEMMSSRTKAFKVLDKDGNNLLSFEEWAVATADRFAQADADMDGKVTRPEFAATAPKKVAVRCKC